MWTIFLPATALIRVFGFPFWLSFTCADETVPGAIFRPLTADEIVPGLGKQC